MKTEEALTRFLQKCEELGKSESTRRHYHGYLRHFAEECPDLPLQTETIEIYLKRRKETPGHRGMHFKCLQAFYSYLQMYEDITSPVPAKGPVGRPSKTGRPITEAVKQGDKLVRGGPNALTSISTSITDLIQKYESFKKAEGVSQRTIEEYHGKLGAFANYFPTLPLDPDQIAQFLGQLKCDPITRWDYRKHIVAFYHFLEKRQIIPIVTPSFPRVKVPHKIRRALGEDEVINLFNHVESFEDKVILTLLIDSKIRASELCTLTREHVHQDHIIVTGKTGERAIPISPLTYSMLTKLAPAGSLFTIEGRPMRREYLRVHIREIMEKAGLTGKKLGPHILRHSASVFHIMHGGDLLSLKEELGHSTLRMTEHYAQLALPQVKQKHKEADVIGHIVSGSHMRRAICFGCNTEIEVELREVKHTKCPGCGQVGRWYLPETSLDEMAEVKQ